MIWELIKPTSETFLLGRCVYRLLSVEDWNWEVNILKLDGFIAPPIVESPTDSNWGNPPSQTPATVVTPDMVKELWETLSTLAYEVRVFPGFVYSTILPTVAIPIKNLLGSVLVTVEIPM